MARMKEHRYARPAPPDTHRLAPPAPPDTHRLAPPAPPDTHRLAPNTRSTYVDDRVGRIITLQAKLLHRSRSAYIDRRSREFGWTMSHQYRRRQEMLARIAALDASLVSLHDANIVRSLWSGYCAGRRVSLDEYTAQKRSNGGRSTRVGSRIAQSNHIARLRRAARDEESE